MNTNQYSQAFNTQLGTQLGGPSSSDYYGQGAAASQLSFQDFGSSQDNSYLQFTEFSQVRRARACPAVVRSYSQQQPSAITETGDAARHAQAGARRPRPPSLQGTQNLAWADPYSSLPAPSQSVSVLLGTHLNPGLGTNWVCRVQR
jgi:hypothetical protein